MGYVSPHGVSSIFRLPKIAAYFYQSQRDPSLYGPMVHICNYWTSTSPTRVIVTSNCEEVALYQDGVLISKKAPELYTNLPHPCFHWIGVPFKPGELKAVGYIGSVEAATDVVHTPGTPAKLTVVPDTAVIYTGGDMTRVVVSMIDQYGQILHSAADSVTLSASGAGDFLGESKTALEGGQMAFYVKTKASTTGTITCSAGAAGVASASATITVVKDQGAVATNQRTMVPFFSARADRVGLSAVVGEKINVPRWARKDAVVSVYDCTGQLLYKGQTVSGVIPMEKFGIARGVRIVKIADIIPYRFR
jgi:hypothetical protein